MHLFIEIFRGLSIGFEYTDIDEVGYAFEETVENVYQNYFSITFLMFRFLLSW